MKPQIAFFVAILAVLFAPQGVSAQGEWKWAHYWNGGNGISANDYYNTINTTAFDSEGNLYVYGMMGGAAQLDGALLYFSENTNVLLANTPAILLAKFDTLGNMLWCKVVKQSTERAVPCWMVVRNNRIYIAGNCGFGGDSHHEWLYYMDTLIKESQITSLPDSLQKPPFKKYSLWTFFAILDLDGNLLEDRFVETFSREYLEPVHLRMNEGLCKNGSLYPSPIHVDQEGNWYIFSQFSYRGVESDPYTIVVYGDSDRVYDLYLPGSIHPSAPANASFTKVVLYKFSPNWELMSLKVLVDHVEGMAPYCPNDGDSIIGYNCHYQGISFDEEDNMYLSGSVQLYPCYPNSGGLSHHYPVFFYWDSTNRLVVHDITSAENANFIIKYDTAGNVVWCNQLHTRGYVVDAQTHVNSSSAVYRRNTCYDNSIYVSGGGRYFIDDATRIYFDDESDTLQRYTEVTTMNASTEMVSSTGIGFFVRYDKNTGEYICHGIVPAQKAAVTRTPGVINNRVFSLSTYGYILEGNNLFVEWRNDGSIIKVDSLSGRIDYSRSPGMVADGRGYVAAALFAAEPLSFSDAVQTHCTNCAAFAMYYDPAFAEPYVWIPDREDISQSVKVWPNPAVRMLQVESEEPMIENVSVLDLAGRRMLRQSVQDYGCQIDVSSLPAGMYLLEIVRDGRKQYGKFVKAAE